MDFSVIMNMHAIFRGDSGATGAPTPMDPRPRRRTRLWIAVAAVAILLAVGWMILGRPQPAPQVIDQTPPVTIIVPGVKPVPMVISATGNLSATRDMPVGISGEGGTVVQVLVDAGDHVRSGQILARIDKSVQVEQARQLDASIRAAKADALLAQAELDRAQALVGRGFISKADIERKVATRDSARAKVSVAEAQLGEMKARIARLDVRAPAAGVVLERSVEAGQVVGSASTALFRIAKDGAVEMRALFAEQEISRLKVGLTAEVTPVGSNQSVPGRIWLISPIVNPQTRQGEARIALPPNPAVRPGGFASVRILGGTADQPVLPESAIMNDAEGSYVMVIGADDKVQRRAVKLGEVSRDGVAIASGLTGAEQVVMSAGAFLTIGEKVKPVRASATAAAR